MDDDLKQSRDNPAFEEYGIARYFLEEIKDVVENQGFSDEHKRDGDRE